MRSGFILRQPDSAPPAFFAPASAKRVAPAHQAWSEDPTEALCFASQRDAQTFVDTFLPNFAPSIGIVPYTEP